MTRFLLAVAGVVVTACTLVNQEPTNAPPTLTYGRADTLQVRRGAQIRLEVAASDEDYDPLFFDWQAYHPATEVLSAILELAPTGLVDRPDQLRSLYGFLSVSDTVGGFADSSAQAVNTWFAPASIDGPVEKFLLVVTVRDRDCGLVADPRKRTACLTGESQFAELFPVQVTQRPPLVTAPADTAVSFREPSITVEAQVSDPDQDPLQVEWRQLSGEEAAFSTKTDKRHGYSRLEAVPFYLGDYTFEVRVSDGADSAAAQVHLHVYPDPSPPEGGTVHLRLPDGHEYDIDRYEFPDQRDAVPALTNSWLEAARRCAAQGKRLCTRAEWIHACRGSQMSLFSSSDSQPSQPAPASFGHRFCNTAGSASAAGAATPTPQNNRAPSGTYPNCSSDYGVYDLTGNVREWVAEMDTEGRVTGGVSESDVQDTQPDSCGSVTRFAPLPADFDYLAPTALDDLPPEYQAEYRQQGVGFRCCR